MKRFYPGLECFGLAIWLLLAAAPASAWHKSDSWARSQFEKATALEVTLESHPPSKRKPRDYQRVIDAYRHVYLEAPTSSKAAASVFAAANLEAEMGQQLGDKDALRAAIQEYQLLRREYPGSKDRSQALLSIGQIYQNDLNDPVHARQAFEEFLHRYPHSPLVEQARAGLNDKAQKTAEAATKQKPAVERKTPEAKKPTNDSAPDTDASDDQPAESAVLRDKPAAKPNSGDDSDDTANDSAPPATAANPAQITAVRHWSTPEFTKIAIDLAAPVQYDSQRIENPDRIFFDLAHTRLDHPLNGKSIDVHNGLVTNIRMAQYRPDAARVVLDIGDVSKYQTVLMTNPPRLVITIYPGQSARAPSPKSDAPKASALEPAEEPKPAPAIKTSISPDGVKRTVVEADSATPRKPSANSDDNADDNQESATTADEPNGKITASPKKKTQPNPETIASLDGQQAALLTEEGSRAVDPPDSNDSASALPPPVAPPVTTRGSRRNSKSKSKNSSDLDLHEAEPTADGDRSLIRALGLKIGRIVIDPGHGGHDTGTIGPNGLEEKDLVLDVSQRLGKLLQTRLGADVVFTRSDDTFIPLETRTAIANRDQADLFISVHANSSHDPDARGVETYYLNFTSSRDALEVAARENQASDKSIHELQDLVKKIALKDKIEESHEFAADVQSSLYSGLSSKSPGLRDRGVKKAPFVVLIGANMPSILAEISFVSNPADEKRLKTPDYRQRIAESLYHGMAKYVSGLSGVKVASKIEKTSTD